jgi:hypothetical protein
MLVEMRTYTFMPGAVAKFMTVYQEKGLEIQKRTLGYLVGYFTTEIGTLNQTVHLWGYDSLDDRQRRRAALAADPNWQTFLAEILPLLIRQESQILTPTSFSPIK